MTTISGSTSAGVSSSGGSGSTSQIASLYKQITQLQNQLKSLGTDDTLTDKQKSEQQTLIENQIQMIQAQITQLEQQQADKAAEKQNTQKEATGTASSKTADGVNRPTAANSLNVYI